MEIKGTAKIQLLTVLILIFFLALSVSVTARQTAGDEAKAAAAQEKAKPTAPSGADGDYVGSETYITCHQDQDRRFKNTVMGKAMAHPRTPLEARGCEACHGPGKAHVDPVSAFAKSRLAAVECAMHTHFGKTGSD